MDRRRRLSFAQSVARVPKAAKTPKAPKESKRALMLLAGAGYAPVRADVPHLGHAGCRAPNGRLVIEVSAWPPSKSNNNQIVYVNGRATLALTQKVRDFQTVLAEAILAQYRTIGHVVEWFRQTPGATPRVANPLFGSDVEVAVAVALYEPYRTNRDSDGIWKVLLDVGTDVGLFHDDVQLGRTSQDRVPYVGLLPTDLTRITLTAIPGPASWTLNPNGRPVPTHIATRWVESGRFRPRVFPDAALPEKEGPRYECCDTLQTCRAGC